MVVRRLMRNSTGRPALAADRSGNLYVAEGGGHIRMISADGTITTIAGNGVCHGGCSQMEQATAARPSARNSSILGRLRSMPVVACISASGIRPRVRRVSTGGVISTVVGNGTSGFSGDGGPATQR